MCFAGLRHQFDMLSTGGESHYDASHQMYENMQSEKKTAGGPAVLNLATGVPQPHDISPTNPVYSQITDVSPLDRQEPHTQADVNMQCHWPGRYCSL